MKLITINLEIDLIKYKIFLFRYNMNKPEQKRNNETELLSVLTLN
jgi:hypothetical protein